MRNATIILIAAALGAITLGVLADRFYRYATIQNKSEDIAFIAREVVTKAELSVDHAVVNMTNLLINGYATCSPNAIAEFQRTVYRSGRIKDLRLTAPYQACSAFAETRSFDVAPDIKPDLAFGQNPDIGLFVHQRSIGNALGVNWGFISTTRLTAIIAAETLLSELVPTHIRDVAAVALLLEEETIVCEKDGISIERVDPANRPTDAVTFRYDSERYPLSAELVLPASFLEPARTPFNWLPAIMAAMLGAAVGGLAARLATMPVNPVVELRSAIRRGEIAPFIQPIFDLATREIVGGEILARWIKPDGTMVSPASFVPLAERSGLIPDMTWHLLNQALRDVGDILRSRPGFKLTVNISADLLLADRFAENLQNIAAVHALPPGVLVLELTERGDFAQSDRLKLAIDKVGKLGFPIALDDTGTGHNGLANLHALSPAIVKIDKMFVDEIGKTGTGQLIVELLVQLAKEIGAKTVAEGIETEEQAMFLQYSGVNEGQGFLVSPAVQTARFYTMVTGTRPVRDLTTADKPALTKAHAIDGSKKPAV